MVHDRADPGHSKVTFSTRIIGAVLVANRTDPGRPGFHGSVVVDPPRRNHATRTNPYILTTSIRARRSSGAALFSLACLETMLATAPGRVLRPGEAPTMMDRRRIVPLSRPATRLVPQCALRRGWRSRETPVIPCAASSSCAGGSSLRRPGEVSGGYASFLD